MPKLWRVVFACMVLVNVYLFTGTNAARAEVEIGELDDGMRTVTFRYTPEEPANRVSLAGSFNIWDLRKNYMQDDDGDGTFELTMQFIEPSEHEYKFVVNDREWVLDPGNPNTRVDGMEENSFLQLGDPSTAAPTGDGENFVPVCIEYLSPNDSAVDLIWGINGFNRPTDRSGPIPENSFEIGDAWGSPMPEVEPGRFRLEVQVPSNQMLDFVFHITAPEVRWDNNGGEGIDYHHHVRRAADLVINYKGDGAGDGGAAPRRGGRSWPTTACLLMGLALGVGWLLWRFWGTEKPLPCAVRIVLVVWIGLFAFAMRFDHGRSTGMEVDEYDYVPISMAFAHMMREGNWQGVIDFDAVYEHPRFSMALFAIVMNITHAESENDGVMAARMVVAICAGLLAAILAIRFPIAGIVWALFGLGWHYTSIAYLDSAMVLFGTSCVLAFDAAMRRAPSLAPGTETEGPPSWKKLPWFWLAASAACAGIAMSCKYLAAVAPLAVTVAFGLWLFQNRGRGWKIIALVFAAYVAFSFLFMFASDWYLWSPDALTRLHDRLTFHQNFSSSELVERADFPWYQPILWPWIYLDFDPLVGWAWLDKSATILGFLGLAIWWKREPRVLIVGVVTMLFLFVWNTKWPQYMVSMVPWLCIGTEACLVESTAGARLLWKHLRGSTPGLEN